MTYRELSDTVKRRLRHEGVCSICLQPITEHEDVHYIKYVEGRRTNYTFFHTSCLMKARKAINDGRV